MKTPSFNELKAFVEFLNDELVSSQLQEVQSTEEGLVLIFYRFSLEPRTVYLVFDLDRPFPFLGLFNSHPWPKQKKSKPVGLFLNAHAKNLSLFEVLLVENLGRVVKFTFGPEGQSCEIEFRLIPKQPNFIVKARDDKNKMKTISWYAVLDLVQNDSSYTQASDEELRSIPFLMKQWLMRRGSTANQLEQRTGSSTSPYEKWKKQKEKDLQKKTNALTAIQKQIDQFLTEPWPQVGEFLKNEGFQRLPPEWSPFVKFDQSVSKNIQICFDKAKAAKIKILGARERLKQIQDEILSLSDLSEKKFETYLQKQVSQKSKVGPRSVEGRYRKLTFQESNLVCYMGKSAQDNVDLLRKSKAWDFWIHLKDYSSAYAILHRQKGQNVSDQDLNRCAQWLIKEGLSQKQNQMGGRFTIVVSECRFVRPIKGDKLGRVTYHEAREILIAL